MTSAIPVRCSTNWAVKPHIGSEVNLLSSYLPEQWTNKLQWVTSYMEKMQLEWKVCSGAKFFLWLFSPVNHAFIPKKVKQWRQQGVINGNSFQFFCFCRFLLPFYPFLENISWRPWEHLLEDNIVLIISQTVQPATEKMKNRKNWSWQTYITILYLILSKKQTNNCKHKATYQLMHDAFFLTQTEFAITKALFYRSIENVKLFEMHNVLWIHEFSLSDNRTASSSKCDEVWQCNLKTLVCTTTTLSMLVP